MVNLGQTLLQLKSKVTLNQSHEVAHDIVGIFYVSDLTTSEVHSVHEICGHMVSQISRNSVDRNILYTQEELLLPYF